MEKGLYIHMKRESYLFMKRDPSKEAYEKKRMKRDQII